MSRRCAGYQTTAVQPMVTRHILTPKHVWGAPQCVHALDPVLDLAHGRSSPPRCLQSSGMGYCPSRSTGPAYTILCTAQAGSDHGSLTGDGWKVTVQPPYGAGSTAGRGQPAGPPLSRQTGNPAAAILG